MPRDIRIQPNRLTTGSTQQPTIFFSGTTAASINLKVEDDGSIVFEGNNGGLFNITDSKDGLLSSVNDVSGLPIFAVYSSDKVVAGGFNQNALIVDGARVFIGTDTISTISGNTKLVVSGNTIVYGTLSASTLNLAIPVLNASNTQILTRNSTTGNIEITTGITASGGGGFSITGFTYSNNNLTIAQNNGTNYTVNISLMTGLTINGNLTVTGNTSVRALTGTSALFSSSAQNVLTVIGSGSSTSYPIFSVQGSSGELFSVSDSLVGSLFSVNDISGLPILEVFSDSTTLMGSYLAPSLNTTVRTTANSGTTNIYSIPISAYTGAFFEYTVNDGVNLRAGNIMSIWSGNTINYTEASTTDIGNTNPITFNMISSGGFASLRTSATTNSWTVKTIVRSI